MYTDHAIVGSVRIMNMNVFIDGCGDEMMNVGWGDGITVQAIREIYGINTEALDEFTQKYLQFW